MHSDMSFAVDWDFKQHYNMQRKPATCLECPRGPVAVYRDR